MSERISPAEASRLVETIPELDGVTHMTAVASGGFSRIYKAFQPALSRTVAIKIVTSDGLDPRMRERFSREMGMTGMLGEHPHIVDVYHHGLTRSGEPFLMMRWYEGGSLADGLRESGPMPTAVLLPFAVKVTSALAYVHRHQLLHRDIKPGNILLTALNEPVLADFGIAVDARQAGTATVAWTPVHAAPEVMAYEEPTPRADIWSLGSTLYAALAGRPPYPVDPGNTLASIQQRFRGAPPPFVRNDVPSSLTDLLAASLASRPEDRPDSLEFVARLQEVERELGLPTTTAPGVITAPPRPPAPQGPRDARPEPDPFPGTPGSFSSQAPDHTTGRRAQPVAPLLPFDAEPADPQEESTLVPNPGPSGRGTFSSEVTGSPDAATVLNHDPSRDRKTGWSWKRRLGTAALSGVTTLVLVLVALTFLVPRGEGDGDETPDPSPTLEAPTVNGLRRVDSSPTSITIAWSTSGRFDYPTRVSIEDGKSWWLEDAEVKALSAVITDLEPGTRYCLKLDVLYGTGAPAASASPATTTSTIAPTDATDPTGTGSATGPRLSTSERRCFRTTR
ncbi:serine/threonine-protein kinase [Kineosporia succinea]|uniref:non-specific serine/threonine protein kinase n=1 Tax=Kineosporia succinea TaxID=84632 RepID=A0ABT9PD68_9ACTN|nr:serine/threonine-protein kinase [Kineosporia succinea]MDP9830649.1 serine/threonine protein kinase [Kineosporia succinea]